MKQLLCYGDSNTWGLIPGTKERYPWGIRWTSILQEKLGSTNVRVIEEGLCGRTTVFEDYYHNSPYIIAKGLSQCVDELLRYINPEKILIVSPIHLGEDVWKEQFDPEFDQKSVEISMGLEKEYKKIARQKQVHFLAASDFVSPSDSDRKHMDAEGHAALAEQIVMVLYQNRMLE